MTLAQLGYFSRTHGTKGQLILKLSADFESDDVKALFIEVGGSKAPYFIQDIKNLGADLIVLLEDVDTIEKAKILLNKTVWIDSQYVMEEAEDDWIGFELIDKQHGSLGKVLSVSDNGSQVLWHFNIKGKEVILPMVEDFIESMDEREKKILYNAPEGLIDVYLEETEENQKKSGGKAKIN